MAHFDPGDYRDHGRLAARLSRPILTELGYSPQEVEAICYAIAVHVDDKADFEHEPTLEAAIVSDADNVDRFGAYRILLWCANDLYNFEALVATLRERLERLYSYRGKRMMGTDAGQKLFDEHLERQITFFESVVAEQAITRLDIN